MIISYQQRRALQRDDQRPAAALATVVEVAADGIRLKFDGETTATQKKYRYNKAISFAAGQRVKVCRVGESWLVEYPF